MDKLEAGSNIGFLFSKVMRMNKISLSFLAIFAILIFHLIQINKLEQTISKLENKVNNTIQMKTNYSCNRGVAVMTPDGHATTVCAP